MSPEPKRMTAKARAIAMAKKCKRRGGDCPCDDTCQAMDLLQKEVANIQYHQRDLQFEIARLSTPPATWRDEASRNCPDPAFFHAVVHHTGDSWAWGWEDEDGEFYEADSQWPWVEDFAYADDWRRQGFEVV